MDDELSLNFKLVLIPHSLHVFDFSQKCLTSHTSLKSSFDNTLIIIHMNDHIVFLELALDLPSDQYVHLKHHELNISHVSNFIV